MAKLLFDLNKYVLDRYNGWKPLLVRYLLIQLVIKLAHLILLEMTEKKDVDSTQKTIGDEKENFSRRETLKRHLCKVFARRGGALSPPEVILQMIQTLLESKQVLGGLILLLQGIKFEDLQVAQLANPYHLYMRPGYELCSGETNICHTGESLFGYLFTILSDDKISLSRGEQIEEIYTQLFKYDRLKPYAKNHKNIVLFLTCVLVFILQFKQSKSGVTVDAFFKALIKAIKEGKISKAVVRRLLVRLNLYKSQLEIPPELEDLVAV